jgi:hypothetical protein
MGGPKGERSVGHAARLFIVAFAFILIIGVAAPALAPNWTQNSWSGGPTTPSLQVGTWTPSYDNFYREENVDWSTGSVSLLLQPLGAQVIENKITVADSYVFDNGSDYNYGAYTNLYVGRYNGFAERGYVKFNISGIPSGVTITGAKLWLYNWGTSAPAYTENVQVERVDDDSWTEGGIKWSNQPSRTGILVDAQLAQSGNVWMSWQSSALTSFVAGERASDSIVSLALIGENENNAPDAHSAGFDTKEWSSPPSPPMLEVTYVYNVFRNGWFESSIYDAGSSENWGAVTWDADTASFGGLDTYTYVSSYDNVKGTVENFENQKDNNTNSWSTLAERKVTSGEVIADHVVISEIYPDSLGSTELDEWVELYNPTGSAISIAGWTFGRWSSAVYVDGTIPGGTSIAAYSFFQIGDTAPTHTDNTSWPIADYRPDNITITNSNAGYYIKDSGGTIIDRVGWGATAPAGSYEGTPCTQVASNAVQSLERKSGPIHDNTKGNGYDTNNNANDFYIRTLPDPQNASSPPETPPSGAVTYDMEIRENIDGIPSAGTQTLQMRYKLANTNDNFHVQVWDSTAWSNRGAVLSFTSWENWSYVLLSSEVIGGKVQVRFVDDNVGSTAQDNILKDYLRVRSQTPQWSTSVVMKLRTGSDNNPYDGAENWSGWYEHNYGAENTLMPDGRYVQYRVELFTTWESETPVLTSDTVVINYTPGGFTFRLRAGWNMISFPVMPNNKNPHSIFPGDYTMFKWNAVGKQYVLCTDDNIENGVGYWLYVFAAENVLVSGTPVDSLTLSLSTGWNLIGVPLAGASIASPDDTPDGSVFPYAFTWDSENRKYTLPVTDLVAGAGYWVCASNSCVLKLPGGG